jgi:hypothetical protein
MSDAAFSGFWELAQREPDRLALVVDHTGIRLTAGELLANVNRVVHGLRALVRRHRGDRSGQ